MKVLGEIKRKGCGSIKSHKNQTCKLKSSTGRERRQQQQQQSITIRKTHAKILIYCLWIVPVKVFSTLLFYCNNLALYCGEWVLSEHSLLRFEQTSTYKCLLITNIDWRTVRRDVYLYIIQHSTIETSYAIIMTLVDEKLWWTGFFPQLYEGMIIITIKYYIYNITSAPPKTVWIPDRDCGECDCTKHWMSSI